MISALYMAYARKQCHNNQVNNPLPLLEKKKKKRDLIKIQVNKNYTQWMRWAQNLFQP